MFLHPSFYANITAEPLFSLVQGRNETVSVPPRIDLTLKSIFVNVMRFSFVTLSVGCCYCCC